MSSIKIIHAHTKMEWHGVVGTASQRESNEKKRKEGSCLRLRAPLSFLFLSEK